MNVLENGDVQKNIVGTLTITFFWLELHFGYAKTKGVVV